MRACHILVLILVASCGGRSPGSASDPSAQNPAPAPGGGEGPGADPDGGEPDGGIDGGADGGGEPSDGGLDAGADGGQPDAGHDAGNAPPSSLASCASDLPDGGFACPGCANGEVCFSTMACQGGSFCHRESGHGDDRCHRDCSGGKACAPGEVCTTLPFYGCTPVSVARPICCPADGGC